MGVERLHEVTQAGPHKARTERYRRGMVRPDRRSQELSGKVRIVEAGLAGMCMETNGVVRRGRVRSGWLSAAWEGRQGVFRIGVVRFGKAGGAWIGQELPGETVQGTAVLLMRRQL